MSFFGGRLSFQRFKMNGGAPRNFGEDHLEKLADYGMGRQRIASADGVDAGWIAGDHILDKQFSLEKNVIVDALQWALRIDTLKLPPELLRAYTAEELVGLAAGNPSGRPSNRQRKEARDRAKDRLEQESKDGRFLKRKSSALMWDGLSGELLVSGASPAVLDKLTSLAHQTFERQVEPLTSGRLAFQLSEVRGRTRAIDDAEPTVFLPGKTPARLQWSSDESSKDFLGNEFFTWLWHTLDQETDSITLADGSEAAITLVRTLSLECPRGETGKETITADAPTRLPEARRALASGKLPRKLGLMVSRHDEPYEFSWSAENLAISGLKLPETEASEERPRIEERLAQTRSFLETTDLIYDAFLNRRTSAKWPEETVRIQKWMQQG